MKVENEKESRKVCKVVEWVSGSNASSRVANGYKIEIQKLLAQQNY